MRSEPTADTAATPAAVTSAAGSTNTTTVITKPPATAAPDPDPAPAPEGRSAALGWAVLLVATLAQLLLSGPFARGESPAHAFDRTLLSAALSTPEGHALMARIVLLAVAAVLGTALATRRGGRWIAAVLTLALATTWSTTSHAASGTLVPLALAVTTVHVASMAVWVGGLISLTVLLTRSDRRSKSTNNTTLDLLAVCRRFSRLALTSVCALAASGLYQAYRELPGFSSLTGTAYGRLLMVKVAILVLVLIAAARSRSFLAHRHVGQLARLRTSVAIELVGVAMVLVVTVLLLSSDPSAAAR